jgi:hypothetical protein
MTYVLDVNDSGLALYRDGTLEYHAPAVAVVRQDEILFGQPALRLSRIHPRETNQQYFSRLNADPLPHPVARASNHADLVYLHLQELRAIVEQNPADVVLAVPGILSSDQLAVLLGIAQECGLTIGGFVDSAVVAATTSALPASIYHIDTHLQRACITHLQIEAGVHRKSAVEVAECGFAHLLDGWVNVISDRFVRDTRFDPLHAAQTEQQLYDQVFDWVTSEDVPAAEIAIEIKYGDHVHRAEFPRTLLEDKAQRRFSKLRDGLPEDAHVVLSARSARLPGLEQFLARHGHEFTVLASDALAQGCAANISQICSPNGHLRLVSRLALTGLHEPQSSAAKPPGSAASVQQPATRPTHALSNNVAIAISASSQQLPLNDTKAGVYLDVAENLLLNGNPTSERTRLNVGDEISTGERVFVMIRVEA